ncbi:helix-turn-helix transcriptional regulator [Falsirhodobacter sp. alg1]|uniref:helix-turn-helix transcriptional regulator n=1 Tax=Falsirhodobacter sp. alg1 TaxID=1472418 RepID=UPI0005EDE515|nr:helix-turn-helix transcriptional regulator [Falsirhodobacter sp. alg1]
MTPEQCKAARALADMSQQDLAEAAEVAKATITNFETGNRRPYKRTLSALQAALEARGVTVTNDGVRIND